VPPPPHRRVVESAREVCIHLTDSFVVFGHVVNDPAKTAAEESFSLRPWGCAGTMDIGFDKISRVTPVQRMDWETQRIISADQLAAQRAG
jgi:hypothetical protein